MKLDRNITNPRRGKYALIKLREAQPKEVNVRFNSDGTVTVIDYEVPGKAVDFGDTPDSDFFVIRLKDKYAPAALLAYAHAAYDDGQSEYGDEIMHLHTLAKNHSSQKMPD